MGLEQQQQDAHFLSLTSPRRPNCKLYPNMPGRMERIRQCAHFPSPYGYHLKTKLNVRANSPWNHTYTEIDRREDDPVYAEINDAPSDISFEQCQNNCHFLHQYHHQPRHGTCDNPMLYPCHQTVVPGSGNLLETIHQAMDSGNSSAGLSDTLQSPTTRSFRCTVDNNQTAFFSPTHSVDQSNNAANNHNNNNQTLDSQVWVL